MSDTAPKKSSTPLGSPSLLAAADLTASAVPEWLDNKSDWLNPILIKEVRQALKSRQFLGMFCLVLIGSWLISLFGILLFANVADYGRTGSGFFSAYMFVLCLASLLFVPFGALRSLMTERDQFTFEVLSISTLKPQQVVIGKLLCSVTQLFIYFSAITPFVAFTYLLRGVDVLTLVMTLITTFLTSIGLSMVCLTSSAMSQNKQWNTLSTIGALIFLFWVGSGFYMGIIASNLFGGAAFSTDEFWWTFGISMVFYAAYFWLLLQISVAQLTFEADNRSTGIRIALTLIMVLAIGLLLGLASLPTSIGVAIPTGQLQEVTLVFSYYALVHLAVLGLFICTEPDPLSKRIRKRLPRLTLVRLFSAMFLPGGARGLIYILVHLAVVLLVYGWAEIVGGSRSSSDYLGTLFATSLYLIIYLNMGTWLARWGRHATTEFKPAHARVMTVLIAALFMIVPLVVSLLTQHNFDNKLLHLTNPAATLPEIASRGYMAQTLLVLLTLAAVVMTLFNLRAMVTGLREVLTAPVLPKGASSVTPPPVADLPRPSLEDFVTRVQEQKLAPGDS